MNNKFPFKTFLGRGARRMLLGFALAFGTATFVHAQGEIGSGTVLLPTGSSPYTYDLTFSDAAGATSPIGSIWYAWVPGVLYLPGTPTSASAPTGWTASVVANSIQFVANSSANDIAPGHSLSGFSYNATFSPAQLTGTPNSGLTFAYSGGIEGVGDPGSEFNVQTVVPEPSGAMLLLSGATAFWFMRRRKLLRLSSVG